MKSSKIIAICVSVVLSVAILLFSLCLWLIFALEDIDFAFFLPLAGLMLCGVIWFSAFSIANKKFYKAGFIPFLSLFVILTVVLCEADYYKEYYIPSITVGQQSSYYGNYLPFSSSDKLAHLEKESSLKFSNADELPVVDGATALFPVYCSFVEAVYPEDCEEITDYVKFSTTAKAYEKLINGDVDIIFVAEPSKEQLKAAEEAGISFEMYPIGYEAFVFIVNKKNPVDSLTLKQIKDIYTGKIKNWKELGGKNQEIRPFQRDKNSGSQTAFLKVIGADAELIDPETHEVFGMDGLVDVVSDYENHNNAIGYSFRYFIQSMSDNSNIKMLKLNDVEATRENIRNKTYPITDSFYAITVKGRQTPDTEKFIQWIMSEQGQELVDKVGYVSKENK